jgi:hypothetical protein
VTPQAPPAPAYSSDSGDLDKQMLQLARFVGLIPFLDDFNLDGGEGSDDVVCVEWEGVGEAGGGQGWLCMHARLSRGCRLCTHSGLSRDCMHAKIVARWSRATYPFICSREAGGPMHTRTMAVTRKHAGSGVLGRVVHVE